MISVSAIGGSGVLPDPQAIDQMKVTVVGHHDGPDLHALYGEPEVVR